MAARGPDSRTFPWGNRWDTQRANGSFLLRTTTPVGSYPDGVSPYGVHDMSGNVNEWVADWFGQGYYAASPERNPRGPDAGSRRILRGGSWVNGWFSLRAARRIDVTLTGLGADSGFRCARNAPR